MGGRKGRKRNCQKFDCVAERVASQDSRNPIDTIEGTNLDFGHGAAASSRSSWGLVSRDCQRNRTQVIFRDEAYYQKFEDLLAILPERFGVRLHTYVLMPNHYHLQIETPRRSAG